MRLREQGGNLQGDDMSSQRTRSLGDQQIETFLSDLLLADTFGGTRRGPRARHGKGCVATEIDRPVARCSARDHNFSGTCVVGLSITECQSRLCKWACGRWRHFVDTGGRRSLCTQTSARAQLRRPRRFSGVRIICGTTPGFGNLWPSCRRASDDGNHRLARGGLSRRSWPWRPSSLASTRGVNRLVLARRGTFSVDGYCNCGRALHVSGFGHEAFVAQRNDSVRTIPGFRNCGICRSDRDSCMKSRPSIAQLKSGDSEAWVWFFAEFSGQIAGYARRMGVSDADDVTGTVLETVARSVSNFSGSHSQFRSWVFSIAHARIVDDHRRRDRRPEVEFTDTHDRTQVGADSLVGSGDPELEVAMTQLTEEQRSLLHLRFVLELSTKEIAQVTDKSEVATRVALHRCSKKLRELLSGGELAMGVES